MSEAIAFNNIIGILSKITPKHMLIAQKEDLEIGKVLRYVKLGKTSFLAQIQIFK